MDKDLRSELISITGKLITKNDPSHDIGHALRVLVLSENIAKEEKGDLDIVVPAALFHDIVNYPKNHHKRLCSAKESARLAKKVLGKVRRFPKYKIEKVHEAIRLCSFTKGLKPRFFEAGILQDADSLEATGAISVMRTFASAGIMKREFYDKSDPFCKKRQPDDSKYAVDLFFTRLLVIEKRLHTQTGKKIAKKRTDFLKSFLDELYLELLEST